MISPNDRHAVLSRELVGSVGRGEIIAYYQPQFSLTTDRIVAAETLSRWRHPKLGTISPGEFIPIAEDSDLIREIGYHMINLACSTALRWCEMGLKVEVAVNVSLTQLTDPAFVTRVAQVFSSLSLDPRLITLEITESKPSSEFPSALQGLVSLAKLGVSISVDDYGAGYSTDSQVSAMPATELKIDQSLTQDQTTPGVERLVAAADFGKSRGLRLVAEGVETTEQLERVRSLGLDRAQGYLLAHPLPRSEVEALILGLG